MKRKAILPKRYHKYVRFYYARCPFCGYEGSGWPDSGECPSCGETS